MSFRTAFDDPRRSIVAATWSFIFAGVHFYPASPAAEEERRPRGRRRSVTLPWRDLAPAPA